MELEALKGWENFYVITGSAAAGLTGLTFVVIALVRDAQRTAPTGVSAFLTPTIVHFTVVLSLAAFLCVPRLPARALEIGLSAVGLGGLAYVLLITHWIVNRLEGYLPVLEDWTFNVALPGAAYSGVLGAGLELDRRPELALDVVAGSVLLLLLIGIHNAWDIAVWMSLHKAQDPQKPP
ncbi:MAG: hypothetical protein JO325_11745 [Solirubrobacterales bacterium]|nr:hypothetical protein [Solirubrobacterales bacterium]